jgi:uncharacterized protein (DUF39 family)/NAD-dependent dihydropyrimidine dehydrogenase PreA subunit
MKRTVAEINERIKKGQAVVLTAEEVARLVREKGVRKAAAEVDVVTTGTFGAMCSSGAWLNFGHSDPPIKMTRVWLNDVEAYAGVAAVDAYLGATQGSQTLGMEYGGAHVIEDLLLGRPVALRAVSYGSDCYPRKALLTEVTLASLNQALLSNPRNAYQRYNAASNSGERTLHTYMGKLLPGCGNVTFSGAGELSPLVNDPDTETVGVGTRIFLGSAVGTVTGPGTQHNPAAQFATLMVQGALKEMSPEFLRAAVFHGYGSSLYVGIGIPIPILNAGMAMKTAIRDRDIETAVVDYAVPSRSRPELTRCNYAQLKSGSLRLRGRDVPAAPLVSYGKSLQVALALKQWIEQGRFTLSTAVAAIPRTGSSRPMAQRAAARPDLFYRRRPPAWPPESGPGVAWHADLCFSCGQCLGICPAGVFSRDDAWRVTADTAKCSGCGLCARVCPVGAISGGRHGG